MTVNERSYSLEQVQAYPTGTRNNLRVGFLSFIWCIAIIAVVAFVLFVLLAELEIVTVKTRYGVIQGSHVQRLDKLVSVFYGIPYAKPPVGKRRFRKPEPIGPWRGILHSNHSKPACIQHHTTMWRKFTALVLNDTNLKPSHESEDCLYMNIYTPAYSPGNARGLRTVLVWFHGGGFILGKINSYDGSVLAAQGDVVVAIVAYRLGIFGFLSTEKDEVPGNMGLYDQRLALRWIRQNIRAFGGDPESIVLFGENSGAVSIGYHLLTPESNKLFQRAILINGGPLTPIMMFKNRNSRKNYYLVLNETGCNRTTQISSIVVGDGIFKWDPDDLKDFDFQRQLQCLRNVDPQILVDIERKLVQDHKIGFYPTESGPFFARHPYDLVEYREYGPQIELMVGTDVDFELPETKVLDKFPAFRNISENVTASLMVERMRKMNPDYPVGVYRAIVDLVMRDDKVLTRSQWANRMTSVWNEFFYRCPDFLFLKSYTEEDNDNQRRVFYFQFNPKKADLSDLLRKWHHNEVFYSGLSRFVFGYPFLDGGNSDRHEIVFTLSVIRMCVDFAQFGNPTPTQSWEPTVGQNFSYLELGPSESKIVRGFPTKDCEDRYGSMYELGHSIYSQTGRSRK